MGRGGKRERAGRVKGRRSDMDETERRTRFNIRVPVWICEWIREKKNRSAYITDLIRKDLDCNGLGESEFEKAKGPHHVFQVSCPIWIYELIRDKKNRSAYIVDLIRKDLEQSLCVGCEYLCDNHTK